LKKKIKDINESIPKQESENKRNKENYDNLLYSARLNFKNELTKLVEKHTSEKSSLQKQLARLKDEFVKKMQHSVGNTMSTNVNQSDASVLKARWKFNLKIDKQEKDNRQEMRRLRISKDTELDMTKKELARLSTEVRNLEQSSTSEVNALKKTIDSLGKELKRERNKISNSPSVRREYSSDVAASEHRYSKTTSPTSVSSCFYIPAAAPQAALKLTTGINQIKKLRREMETVRTTLEWEKNNLKEALLRERLPVKETSVLQSVASSLTLAIIEKDEIIERLKASNIALRQQLLLEEHKCPSKGGEEKVI